MDQNIRIEEIARAYGDPDHPLHETIIHWYDNPARNRFNQQEEEKKSIKALKEMEKESIEKQNSTDECTICLANCNRAVEIPADIKIKEELKMNEKELSETIVIMECKHRFHLFCLSTWLEAQQTCPTCRSKVKTDGEVEEEQRLNRVEELHNAMFS